MINIPELLKERAAHPFTNASNDSWVDEIIEKNLNDKSVSLIVPVGFLWGTAKSVAEKKEKLFQNFRLAAVYDVGRPFLNTSISFVALELTKEQPQFIKIAAYKGETIVKEKKGAAEGSVESGAESDVGSNAESTDRRLVPGEKFTQEFQRYHSRLRVWETIFQDPEAEKNKDLYEFCKLPVDEYDPEHPEPGCYTEKMRELRKVLKSEDLLRVKDVAEVYAPHPGKGEGLVFSFASAGYPYEVKTARKGKATDVLIQKGDILVTKTGAKYYLFNDEAPKDLYAPRNVFVIRPNQSIVSPEYLYLYLRCDTGQQICSLDRMTRESAVLPGLKKEGLENFPVIKQTRPADFYAGYFRLRYLKEAALGEYNTFFAKANPEVVSSAEDILSLELFRKLEFYKKEAVLEIVNSDLTEVNNCYKAKAYKATLIMAGSVLEAVLIDWLSELEREDFFQPLSKNTKCDYMQKRIYRDPTFKPQLVDYIAAIPEVGYPDWIDKAEVATFKHNATQIREKRNLVHATLCLKDCEKINAELCQRVIGYLKEILEIRFKIEIK